MTGVVQLKAPQTIDHVCISGDGVIRSNRESYNAKFLSRKKCLT